MIILDIVAMEARNESGLVFKIGCFDGVCAELEIKQVVSREGWPEVSKAIQQALDKMFPDDSPT